MNQGYHRRTPAPRVQKARPAWMNEVEKELERDPSQAVPAPVREESPAPPRRAAPEQPARRRAAEPEIIATNTAIRLTCLLCAMCGFLGAFMCWAEKESRAIRHYAVQSAALLAIHGAGGAMLLLLGAISQGIPYLGFLVSLGCWIAYFALLSVLVIARVRMMLHAWRGERYELPLLGRYLEKYN